METLNVRADLEEVAKQEVSSKAVGAEERVMKLCRQKHENLSGCMAERFVSLSTMMGSLSFTARKTLEDAIAQDCQKTQGRCSKFIAGKVQCLAVVDPSAGTQEGEKEEGSKKEAKKKS